MAYTAFAKVYDRLTMEIPYAQRAEYFHTILQKHQAGSGILLDLACGTGSLSVEFAKLGYDVIGVDGSSEMLSEAMQKNNDEENNVLYLCQMMEELDLYGTIDAAICALDSLNHVTDPDILQTVLDRVSLFCNPGAIFIFDVNTPYKHEKILGNNTFVYDLEDVYCVWQNSYHPENCTVDISLDIFELEDGAYYRQAEEFSERAYSHEQLEKMIEKAGFELLEVYAGDSFAPPQMDSQRLVYVARKAGTF